MEFHKDVDEVREYCLKKRAGKHISLRRFKASFDFLKTKSLEASEPMVETQQGDREKRTIETKFAGKKGQKQSNIEILGDDNGG